jgi:hypothetical protein
VLGHSRNPESNVINTRSSVQQGSESTELLAPESFSSETVSASKPAPRRIDVYSVGRFSSTLNFSFAFQRQIHGALARQLSRIRQCRIDIRVRRCCVVPQYLFARHRRRDSIDVQPNANPL